MARLYVIDIDGVIADSSRREAAALEVSGGERNSVFWEVFLNPSKVYLDKTIAGVGEILARLQKDKDAEIVLLSSRPMVMYDATHDWLRSWFYYSYGDVPQLVLKPVERKYAKTTVWKAEVVLDTLLKGNYEEVIFIDDEEANRNTVKSVLADMAVQMMLAKSKVRLFASLASMEEESING